MSPRFIEAWIIGLEELLERSDEAGLIAHLKRLVPEYQPNGMWGSVEGERAVAAGGGA